MNCTVVGLPGLFSLLLLESSEWSWGQRGFGRSTSPLLGSVVQLRWNFRVGPLLNTSNGPHSYTEELLHLDFWIYTYNLMYKHIRDINRIMTFIKKDNWSKYCCSKKCYIFQYHTPTSKMNTLFQKAES